MAAGITDHCWTMQGLLVLHVPSPPGLPRGSVGAAHVPCNT
jgi:hypothetical protein